MKKQYIRTRKFRYGGIAAVLTVLVIAVTVLVNAVFGTLATRYSWYTSMAAELNYDVSETCFDLLGEAFADYGDVHAEIILCDSEQSWLEDSTMRMLYETATALSERYPEQLTVHCYDVLSNPNTVRDYAVMTDPNTGEDYQVALKSTSVIIASEEYHRVYTLQEFYAFQDGDTSKLWAYNGERKLAAGILHAVSPEEHVVCMTNNHGEVFYDLELLYLLDDAGYTVRYLDLYNDEIPENCEMIISYNPNSDIIADDPLSDISETDKLDEFLSEPGNSFWVLMENGTPELPILERYLETWGIDFCYAPNGNYRYMMQDPTRSLTSDGYTIYADAVQEGRSAEFLKELSRPVIFKNATAIKNAEGFLSKGDGSYEKGNRTLYSLYEGGADAVAWANGKPVASGENAILMSMTEQKNADGASYVGAVASVDFFSEQFLQSAVYGNGDAFMRAFANAGREHLPEGLTLKPFQSTDISTVTTRQMLYWTIALSVTPAILITVIAVVVLVKRRQA